MVRVIAAVFGLQLSSQLRLAVAHCATKTDVLAHLLNVVMLLTTLMTIMVMMMMIIRIMVVVTVSSGGRFEVRRRDVAVERWDGGGALVNYDYYDYRHYYHCSSYY